MFDDRKDLEHLSRVCAVLDEFGVPWWLDQGTCLGFVRAGAPMAWDNDIDLGVWATDLPENHPAWQRFEELGYCLAWNRVTDFTKLAWPGTTGGARTIDIARYRRHGDEAHRYFGRPSRNLILRFGNTLIFHTRNAARHTWARRHGAAEGLLYFEHDFKGLRWLVQRSLQGLIGLFMLALPESAVLWIVRSTFAKGGFHSERLDVVAPARFFDRLEPVEAAGRTWHAPSPVEEYLEFKFGDDWRTPRRNWQHFKDDGGLAR